MARKGNEMIMATEQQEAIREETLYEALSIMWDTIHALEDLHIQIKGYSDIAHTAFCAAEGPVVTVGDLHGVFFMLSDGLFSEAERVRKLIDSAHDRQRANETLQEANHRRVLESIGRG